MSSNAIGRYVISVLQITKDMFQLSYTYSCLPERDISKQDYPRIYAYTSNTTGATYEAEIAQPPGASYITPVCVGVRVAQYFVFYLRFMFCFPSAVARFSFRHCFYF